uniref:Uncharacterized protein n=1 Tax=Arundo donax TaxID=35708 RepID=A0A0A8YCZ4_ARUDO
MPPRGSDLGRISPPVTTAPAGSAFLIPLGATSLSENARLGSEVHTLIASIS